MSDLAHELRAAIAAILRAIKITEPSVQVAHRALKLSPSDAQTLRFVAERPGCTAGALAAHLGVVPTTATSVVDRLTRAGLVSRTRPERDRRTVALDLTGAGREAFAALDAEERATAALMLEALPENERAAFVAAAGRIADRLANIRSP